MRSEIKNYLFHILIFLAIILLTVGVIFGWMISMFGGGHIWGWLLILSMIPGILLSFGAIILVTRNIKIMASLFFSIISIVMGILNLILACLTRVKWPFLYFAIGGILLFAGAFFLRKALKNAKISLGKTFGNFNYLSSPEKASGGKLITFIITASIAIAIFLAIVSIVLNQRGMLGPCFLVVNKEIRWDCYVDNEIEKLNVSIMCDKIENTETANECYTKVAVRDRDLSLCDKFGDLDKRNDCYIGVAAATSDISICDKIELGLSRNNCYEVMGGNLKTESNFIFLCGDKKCDAGENFISCPEDCSACGDGVCAQDESPLNCYMDCGDASSCDSLSDPLEKLDCGCNAYCKQNGYLTGTCANSGTTPTFTRMNSGPSCSNGLPDSFNKTLVCYCKR